MPISFIDMIGPPEIKAFFAQRQAHFRPVLSPDQIVLPPMPPEGRSHAARGIVKSPTTLRNCSFRARHDPGARTRRTERASTMPFGKC